MGTLTNPQRERFTRKDTLRIVRRIRADLTDTELATYRASISKQIFTLRAFILRVKNELNAIAAMQSESALHLPLSIGSTITREDWKQRKVKQKRLRKPGNAAIDSLLARIQKVAYGIWSLPFDNRDPLCTWHCDGERGKLLYAECDNLHQLLHKRIYRQDKTGELHCNAGLRKPVKTAELASEENSIKSVSDTAITLTASLANVIDDITSEGQQVCDIVKAEGITVDVARFSALLAEFASDFREIKAYPNCGDNLFELIDMVIGDIMSVHYQWSGKTERYTNLIDDVGTSGVLYKILKVLVPEFGYPRSRVNIRIRTASNADRLEIQRIRSFIEQRRRTIPDRDLRLNVDLVAQELSEAGIRFRNKPVSPALLYTAIQDVMKYSQVHDVIIKLRKYHKKTTSY